MSIIGFTDIGGGRKGISVDHDPTSVATDAPKGSLIIDGDGKLYRKTDDGATTSVVDVGMCKCNYVATTAPTVNDDVDLGYSIGSYWYDVTADKAYVCLDATDDAAVWKEITPVGEAYVDRGDPAGADLLHTGMTIDGLWHDWDISGIVPPAAHGRLVLLHVTARSATPNHTLVFRQKGRSNDQAQHTLRALVANAFLSGSGWVLCDANGILEYSAGTGYNNVSIVVAGWME